MKINGSVAFITGGASGLGKATLQRLVAGGAKVGFMDLSEEAGKTIMKEYEGKVVFTPGNVTVTADIEAAVNKTVEKFGRIDILGNMAGVVLPRQVLSRNGTARPLDEFTRVVDIDLVGTYDTLRLVAEVMYKNEPNEEGERGVIINTSSIAAYEGLRGQPAYSAAKGGVASLVLPIAREFAPLGIRVMGIAPGYFDTAVFDGMKQETRDGFIDMLLFPKRFGKPYEEFAFLFEHIVQNPYLNGSVIRLDGAQRMQ